MTLRSAIYILCVIAADQVSKIALIDLMSDRNCRAFGDLPVLCTPIEVTPFFDLVMVWNTGVSFGLFSEGGSGGRYLLIGLSLAISIGLIIWLTRTRSVWLRFSLPLVIGGAIGNVIDRLVYGAVADFFHLYVGAWSWPAFNIADTAICIGVAGLFFDSLFGGDDRSKRTG